MPARFAGDGAVGEYEGEMAASQADWTRMINLVHFVDSNVEERTAEHSICLLPAAATAATFPLSPPPNGKQAPTLTSSAM